MMNECALRAWLCRCQVQYKQDQQMLDNIKTRIETIETILKET